MADPTNENTHVLSKENMRDYVDFLDTAQKDAAVLVETIVRLEMNHAPEEAKVHLANVAKVGLLVMKELAQLRVEADFEILRMPDEPQ